MYDAKGWDFFGESLKTQRAQRTSAEGAENDGEWRAIAELASNRTTNGEKPTRGGSWWKFVVAGWSPQRGWGPSTRSAVAFAQDGEWALSRGLDTSLSRRLVPLHTEMIRVGA
jgi:hypothetical protein